MIELLRREFIVELPPEKAWDHLARVECWLSWARHIRQVQLYPANGLGAQSTGLSGYAMALNRGFEWCSLILIEAGNGSVTFSGLLFTMIIVLTAPNGSGRSLHGLFWQRFGAKVFGRLFANIYATNLDKAIPALIKEMNAVNGKFV